MPELDELPPELQEVSAKAVAAAVRIAIIIKYFLVAFAFMVNASPAFICLYYKTQRLKKA